MIHLRPLAPGINVYKVTAILLTGIVQSQAIAAVSLLGVQYQQDEPYTEYLCLWHDRDYPTNCQVDVVGAHAHVFLKNDGASAVSINDVTLAGYSLDTVIKYRLYNDHPSHSIHHYWENPPQAIFDAGEPVWFKGDPMSIPAGGVAQAVIRLRRIPTTGTISVGVVTGGGTINTTIPVNAAQPALASVGFSEDLTKVHLHWRRSGGAAPATIRMDGTDVTANTVTVGDSGADFALTVLTLSTPLTEASYHVFQGIYNDGAVASAGLRTRARPIMHGTWHSFEIADGDLAAAAAWINTCKDRGINALIMQSSGGLVDYLQTGAGRQHAAAAGYRCVIDYYGKFGSTDPFMWFLDDEPDIEENTILNNFCNNSNYRIPCGSDPTGIMGRHFISEGETLRNQYNAPTTINMNGTYKPRNYYSYGQAVDSLMIDSYYQKRVMDSYYYFPNTQPLYAKATVIYATTLAGTRATEPNPFNILLFSCEANPANFPAWPFASPETKRTEVYYALAGGAKGIGYWWFKPSNASNGLGDQADPRAQILWKEIGLLGAEIKTVTPQLAMAHPVDLQLQPSTHVWVRGLVVDPETLMLIVVNDNHWNDQNWHGTPVSNATIGLTLPNWMQSPSPTAFEVSASGISDVGTQLNGNQLQLSLGTLEVTRMILVTRNSQLRASIQQRYEQDVWPGVCNFAPDYCNPQDTPPAITQHPQAQTVCEGGTASFTVGAAGSGMLSYAWQKDQQPLTNGGHYAGVTTPTLTISSASAADAAGYQCVVSNAYGNTTSNEAGLTLQSCEPGALQNPGFEEGFGSGVGTGWNKFALTGDVTCTDETTQVHGGAHSQEVFSTDDANDGGVFQQLAATPGAEYTVKAWFNVYSPQGSGIAEGFLGIDPAGGADPAAPTVQWYSRPFEYWNQKVWTGTATGSAVTVYLRGRSTKAPGQGKTGYVWFDDIEFISDTIVPVIVPADFDEDGDVDHEDFGHLQACLTASSVPITDPGCFNANLDGDSDVDSSDFALFLQCLSGHGAPPDPDCAN